MTSIRLSNSEFADRIMQDLEAALPEVMRPIAMRVIDGLPRTSSGKIDRKALAEADLVDGGDFRGAAFTAPTTQEEQRLCAIWEAVLGTRPIGIDEDFFSLGGDSIRAVQFVSRASRDGLDVDIKATFELRTIRRLAILAAERAVSKALEDSFGKLRRPLAPICPGLHKARLAVKHPLAVNLLEQALANLVSRHDALRLRLANPQGQFQETQRASTMVLRRPSSRLQNANDITLAAAEAGWHSNSAASIWTVVPDTPDEIDWFWLIVSDDAIDCSSFAKLLRELDAEISRLRRSHHDAARPGPSYLDWLTRLRKLRADGTFDDELDGWRALFEGDHRQTRTLQRSSDPHASEAMLDQRETEALFGRLPGRDELEPLDVLSAALLSVLPPSRNDWHIVLDAELRRGSGGVFSPSEGLGSFAVEWPTRLQGMPDTQLADALICTSNALRHGKAGPLGFAALRAYPGQDASLPSPFPRHVRLTYREFVPSRMEALQLIEGRPSLPTRTEPMGDEAINILVLRSEIGLSISVRAWFDEPSLNSSVAEALRGTLSAFVSAPRVEVHASAQDAITLSAVQLDRLSAAIKR